MHEYTPNKSKNLQNKIKILYYNYTYIILFFYTVFTMEKSNKINTSWKKEIRNALQKIIIFADLERFLDTDGFEETKWSIVNSLQTLWVQLNEEIRNYIDIELLKKLLQKLDNKIKYEKDASKNIYYKAMSTYWDESTLMDVRTILQVIISRSENNVLALIENWALEYNWSVVQRKTDLATNLTITEVNWVPVDPFNIPSTFKPWDVVEFETP
jgi:hypothetical protein